MNNPPRRILRVVGWNVVLAIAGVAGILIARELYSWLTIPFMASHRPMRFVPGVGFVIEPNAEVRHTNGLDFWTVSRTNSLGFLDREPVSPERAATSCHISIIGDSFVEAAEVPIADKFQVRLEALAARAVPHLDVTTSAFGMSATGQINQLALYNAYARRLNPKLEVLVFVHNDFVDNSRLLSTVTKGWGPDRLPYQYADRSPDGRIRLLPPDPEPEWNTLQAQSRFGRIRVFLRRKSRFLRQLDRRLRHFLHYPSPWHTRLERLKSVSPRYRAAFGDWRPLGDLGSIEGADEFIAEDPPPVFKEALAFTAFALVEFKHGADRDGFTLLIMPYQWWTDNEQDRRSALLRPMADAAGIPIISMHAHMTRQGAAPEEAHWPHDGHWNPAGHQWAAETLLDYLTHNQDICTS